MTIENLARLWKKIQGSELRAVTDASNFTQQGIVFSTQLSPVLKLHL